MRYHCRMGANYRVEVSVEEREDGGLRAWSKQLPELVLSYSDARAVLADLPVALSQILRARFGVDVSVEELRDMPLNFEASGGEEPGVPPLQYVARAA